ncbi:hypothetical protein QGX15_gp130 [Pseudomonas phage psageK4e]|uniref:Uncharacterized protein n=1 Tax=Pseudomonas phage psageK4e TaxID=2875723 RepID=A0AAE9BSH3_9CAUD|nr:hypothetical protein QGX15_gp130 [Pseudomonas phage psageK4e]UAW53565.1 hypothetical protein psageK4e_117 [Pseudomonas phage psageK4e]
MKFIVGLGLCAVAMFGSIFMVQANHFDDQKMACKKAEGRGSLVVSRTTGIPIGYECMRMHLVLKYRNGEYR